MLSRSHFFLAVALLFAIAQSSQAQLFGKKRPKVFGRCVIPQALCNEACCSHVSNQTAGSPGPVQPPRTCREQLAQDTNSCSKLKNPDDFQKCMAIAESRRRRCPPLGEFNPRPIETDGNLQTTPEQCLDDYNLCIHRATNLTTQEITPEERARCEDIFFNCLRNSTPIADNPGIPVCEQPQLCYNHRESVPSCRTTPLVKRILRLRCR